MRLLASGALLGISMVAVMSQCSEAQPPPHAIEPGLWVGDDAGYVVPVDESRPDSGYIWYGSDGRSEYIRPADDYRDYQDWKRRQRDENN